MLKKVVLLFGCLLGTQISIKAAAYNGPGDKETSSFVPLALKCALAAYSPETAAEVLADAASTYTRSGSVPVIETFGENNGFVYFNGDVESPEIIVAFRGTQQASDWKFNLAAIQGYDSTIGEDLRLGMNILSFTSALVPLFAPAKFLAEKAVGFYTQPGYKAHSGFVQYYLALAGEVMATIQRILNNHALLIPSVSFIFTGHSLGGAAAHIAAVEFKRQLSGHETWFAALSSDAQPDDAHVRLITACSPRVFCSSSATKMEAHVGRENIIRLWRTGDPVSALPQEKDGYHHIGFDFKIPAVPSLNPLAQHDIGDLVEWVSTHGLSAADQNHMGTSRPFIGCIIN